MTAQKLEQVPYSTSNIEGGFNNEKIVSLVLAIAMLVAMLPNIAAIAQRAKTR